MTLHLGAVNLDRALEQISKAGNVKWEVSPALRNEVIFLHVDDVPLEQLRTRLANLVGAEWQASGDTWFLSRTNAADQRLRQAETQARAARIKSEVDRIVTENRKLPTFDEGEATRITTQFQSAAENMQRGGNWRRFVELSQQLPGGRAIAELVAFMNPADLAAMPPNSRRVFAARPTRMQTPLTGNVMAIAQEMVRGQRVLAQSATANFGPMGMMIANGGNSGPMPTGDPVNVLLVAQRVGSGETISVTMTAVNAQGQALATGNLTLGIPPEARAEVPEAFREGKTISLTQASKDLLAMLRAGFRGGNTVFAGGRGNSTTITVAGRTTASGSDANAAQANPAPQNTDLRAKLLRPDLHEPLNFFVAEGLKAVAQAHERNVIALVPDYAFSSLAGLFQASGDVKTDAFVRAALQEDMVITEGDGWITFQPRDVLGARDRIDRAALAKLLSALNRSLAPRLDDLAEYFASAPLEGGGRGGFGGFGATTIETGYLLGTQPGSTFQEMMQIFGHDRDAYRFYGRLSGSQRTALKSGQPIPFNMLTAGQREVAERMIFWSFDGPMLRQANGNDSRNMAMMRFGGAAFGFGSNPAEERTTLLANGIPGNATISMTVDSDPAVLARVRGGRSTMLSLQALAMNRLALEGGMPPAGGFRVEGTPYDEFMVIQENEYELNFNLGPIYVMSRELEDPQIPGANFVAYNQLPVPFRNRVDREMREARERMARAGNRMGGPGGGPRPAIP